MLTLPQCANNQYWFITEEWNELVETSPIATLENPNPQQMRGIIRRKQNLVIAMHPVAHAVLQQASGKQDYVLTDPLLIKRELYDWVIYLNQQSKVTENGNLERELREQIESDSSVAESPRADSGAQVSSDKALES